MVYGKILDLTVINSWIIVNSRLRGDENYSSTSHGKIRLIFKYFQQLLLVHQ